jgi:xanthine dehydrogenase accessory factor
VNNRDILFKVVEELDRGRPVALVTLVNKEGSGPRGLGSLMIVTIDGLKYGTIGGGEFEAFVIKESLSALKEGKPRRVKMALRRENIPPDAVPTNMLCGGVVEVFINVLKPKPRLILVGAGHVGKPIADIGNILGYRIVVVDKDPGLASRDRYPYAEVVKSGSIIDELKTIEFTENDIAVIAFGEVETDYQVLKHLVSNGFKGHIWVLCSRNRAKWMFDRLVSEGVDVSSFSERIHMPAGLNIEAETPEEIAVSIWSEIICVLKSCRKPVPSLSILDK